MKNTKQAIALASAAALSVGMLAGCGGSSDKASTDTKAESTAEKLKKETPECKVQVFDLADEAKLKEEVANADILVNATLAGMKPHEELTLIKDKSMFRPDLVVADVVYNLSLIHI